jgi:excisionase family DNA binding protein
VSDNQLRLGRDVLTVGQVSQATGISRRTLAKYIDAGDLKGYRVPKANCRRVLRTDLIAFARSHGIPLHSAYATLDRVLAVWLTGQIEPAILVSPLEIGSQLADGTAGGLLIGCQFGAGHAVQLANEVLVRYPGTRIGIVVEDDLIAGEQPAISGVRWYDRIDGMPAICAQFETNRK